MLAPEWVATYQSLKRGTYLSDLGGDLKQTGVNIKNAAIADWNYTTKTPIVQQLKDRGNQLVQPQTLEQAVTMYIGSKIPNNIGTRDNLLRVSTVKVVKTELSRLQNTFDNLVESDLISKYKALDPKLKYGYTGSFKTGVVGNTSKPTFGNPINLEKFDIDFWIESDVLYKKFGPNLRADPQFRKVLAETPGFEGLKPNKEGFSIKFKPNN
ncbi:hypothetical protein [Pedobacter helvus]|uniref:Uncharacterized protein n=1 Tax=Pedobacter helvus TaxID=2563444 RepID=A0ABW9JEY9_9SPHI|nr:hypothetical protein [Pedobacter ureilyticus]